MSDGNVNEGDCWPETRELGTVIVKRTDDGFSAISPQAPGRELRGPDREKLMKAMWAVVDGIRQNEMETEG